MQLDAFTTMHIQNMLALLSEAETAGITDARFIRQRLADELHKRLYERRKRYTATATRVQKCPDCNTPLVKAKTGDKDTIILACDKCRYSTIVTEAKNVPCCGEKST